MLASHEKGLHDTYSTSLDMISLTARMWLKITVSRVFDRHLRRVAIFHRQNNLDHLYLD